MGAGDIVITRKENDSSAKFLWIESIGLDSKEIHELGEFLRHAHLPWSFIVADESVQLLSPEKVAEKFQHIADFITKQINESTAEAPTRLWS